MNNGRPAWLIFSRPESRDVWWVERGEPSPNGEGWGEFGRAGTARNLEAARDLVPGLLGRTLIWSTKDPGRCTREIWQ